MEVVGVVALWEEDCTPRYELYIYKATFKRKMWLPYRGVPHHVRNYNKMGCIGHSLVNI